MFRADTLLPGPHSICLRRSSKLRLGDFVKFVLSKRHPADDRILCGEPIKHQLRYNQHAELGGRRGDEYCHYAGDIHLHLDKRFNEHESDGDDHLHARSVQFLWHGHLYGNDHRHRKHSRAVQPLARSRLVPQALFRARTAHSVGRSQGRRVLPLRRGHSPPRRQVVRPA